MTVIIIGFILFIAWLFIKDSMQKSLSEQTRQKLDDKGLSLSMGLIHLQGLDLGEGTNVSFSAAKNIINIKSGQIKYTIDVDQITSVSMQSISNTLADDKFSIKKAVVGTVLFGDVGGAVGGFSGKGNPDHKSMIINYISDSGNSNNLVFMPSYPDAKNKMSVKMANNMLYTIVDNINYIINKNNAGKPQIVKKL